MDQFVALGYKSLIKPMNHISGIPVCTAKNMNKYVFSTNMDAYNYL